MLWASGLPSDKWGQGCLCHSVSGVIYVESPRKDSAPETPRSLFFSQVIVPDPSDDNLSFQKWISGSTNLSPRKAWQREAPTESLRTGSLSMSGLSHWLWVKQSPKGFPPIGRLQVGRRGHGVGLAAKRINKFRKPGSHLSSVELRLLECGLEAVSLHQWCGMTVASGPSPSCPLAHQHLPVEPGS